MADPSGIVWDDEAPSSDGVTWDDAPAPANFRNVRSGSASVPMQQYADYGPEAMAMNPIAAKQVTDSVSNLASSLSLDSGVAGIISGEDYADDPTDTRQVIGVGEGLARRASDDILSGWAEQALLTLPGFGGAVAAQKTLGQPTAKDSIDQAAESVGLDETKYRFKGPRQEFIAKALPDAIVNAFPVGGGAHAIEELGSDAMRSTSRAGDDLARSVSDAALIGEHGPEAQGAAVADEIMGQADARHPTPQVTPREEVAAVPDAALDTTTQTTDLQVPTGDVIPEAAPLPQQTPDAAREVDQGITERFAAKMADHDAVSAEYAAHPDTDGGIVLNTDTARELSPDYLADRTKSAEVHEPASAFIKRKYAEKLAQPTPEGLDSEVMFTAGGTGAGKSSSLDALRDTGSLGKPEIVYDTNMNTYASARQKVDQALEAGRKVKIVYTYRDPVEALTGGALPRTMRQEAKFGTGRTVPMSEHLKTHVGSYDTINQLARDFHNDPRVEVYAVDNSRGKGNARAVDLSTLSSPNREGLENELHQALDREHQAGRISDQTAAGFRARSSRDAEPSRPQVGPVDGGRPESPGAVQSVSAPTGVKNAVVDEERAQRGLKAVEHDLSRTDQEGWQRAAQKIAENPNHGRDLAASLVEKPRPISKEEVFALTQDRERIRTERRQAYTEAERALDAGDVEGAAQARLRSDRLDEEMEKNDIAARKTGHENAEGFRARQRLTQEDYSMASLVQRAKVRKGAALTDAERTHFENLAKDIEKRETALAEREAALKEAPPPRTRRAAQAKTSFDSLAEQLKAASRKVLCEV